MTYPSLLKSLLFIVVLAVAPAVCAQEQNAAQQKTKERLGQLLQRVSSETKMEFKLSDKNPFLYSGILSAGLKNCNAIEVTVAATTNDTIAIKAYPHYNNGYINIDKVRNTSQLMRTMLQFNQTSFLFWGADNTGDIFSGYTFTLESGFPDEALRIVLLSIANTDGFVGKLRPSIDGSNAP